MAASAQLSAEEATTSSGGLDQCAQDQVERAAQSIYELSEISELLDRFDAAAQF